MSFLLEMAGASWRLGRLGRGRLVTAGITLVRHLYISMIQAGREQVLIEHDAVIRRLVEMLVMLCCH